ncbi:hypothetical protein ABKV19_024548 [Rosa sericea]
MGETKGDNPNKQQQQPQQISASPNDPLEEASPLTIVVTGATASFNIPAPLYVPISGATSSSLPFDQQQFEAVNPKRPRYTSTGQWKLLPSPSSQQKQTPTQTPSPNPKTQPQSHTTTGASSSDTASSPPHSPLPSLSATSGQDTTKTEGEEQNPSLHRSQFRRGKYVSPVWKPHEMLWLAKAWRAVYQSQGSDGSGSSSRTEHHSDITGQPTRAKTRADKDKEVAEFLQKNGINRDAKTAGTKWDNMLGEFRKVYEWERGAEREQIGNKSYFRLSPYERKLHRLPASFDEEVFDELAQFMGSRMRTPPISRTSDSTRTQSLYVTTSTILPQPPSFRDDDLPLSGRARQLMIMSGGGEVPFYPSGRSGSLLGFDHLPPYHHQSSLDYAAGVSSSTSSLTKELRRIGKIRMTWEESVSLWAEEGEHQRGRVKIQGGSSFLNADELAFFDDSMVACTMEAFEDGTLRGFSVDRFVSGQQVKVFGRRKPSSPGFTEKTLPFAESSIRSMPPWEFQDPSEYYITCLRVPPPSLPRLSELSSYLLQPPPEELRFPLRKDVYRDLPQGRETFFTASNDSLDCRAITYDIVSPIIRSNYGLSAATSRDSFIGLWDDCINRFVSKFCCVDMVFIRKATSSISITEALQDQWPNVTGFVKNYCLWRGEEIDQVRDGHIHPSKSLAEKLQWTYNDLPYIFGYYSIGNVVTFCALSKGGQDRIIETNLHTIDLSLPSDRLKALVLCYRVAGLLPLLADRCFNINSGTTSTSNGAATSYKFMFGPYSDFERVDLGNGNIVELTPNTVTRFFSNQRKWLAVKEIYDFLDHRIPHAEYIHRSSEKDLALVFKPRGCKFKPRNCDELVEALKYVTKALVALHDLSFMHRDICWDKVMRSTERDNEWLLCGFDEAVGAPQLNPYQVAAAERGEHAPELERALHGVKVDVWGVGHLVRTCGLAGVPKMLRELQNRCLDQNPELRPTAADCYHHLLQLQSSLSVVTAMM